MAILALLGKIESHVCLIYGMGAQKSTAFITMTISPRPNVDNLSYACKGHTFSPIILSLKIISKYSVGLELQSKIGNCARPHIRVICVAYKLQLRQVDEEKDCSYLQPKPLRTKISAKGQEFGLNAHSALRMNKNPLALARYNGLFIKDPSEGYFRIRI